MNPKYYYLKRKIQAKTALFELANRFQYEYGEYPSYNQFVYTINGVAAQLNESVTSLSFLQNDEYLSEQHVKLLSEQLLGEGFWSSLLKPLTDKLLKPILVAATLHGGAVPVVTGAVEQGVKQVVKVGAAEAEQVAKVALEKTAAETTAKAATAAEGTAAAAVKPGSVNPTPAKPAPVVPEVKPAEPPAKVPAEPPAKIVVPAKVPAEPPAKIVVPAKVPAKPPPGNPPPVNPPPVKPKPKKIPPGGGGMVPPGLPSGKKPTSITRYDDDAITDWDAASERLSARKGMSMPYWNQSTGSYNYMPQTVTIQESRSGTLNTKSALQARAKKQKYKVTVVENGKKLEVFATSIRGIRRVVYGKKNFRVHDGKGADITNYFKRLMSSNKSS